MMMMKMMMMKMMMIMMMMMMCRSAVVDESRQCSLYMKELDQFVSRAANTYLAQFICNDFIIHRSLLALHTCHCSYLGPDF